MRRSHIAEVNRTAVMNKAVTIAYAVIKIKFTAAEMLLNRLDDLGCFGTRNIACGVVNHSLVLIIRLVGKRYNIASECNIVISHFNSDADSLKRRTSCVIFLRIISHNAEVRNVAAGLEPLGNRSDKSDFATLSEMVKIRLVCNHHRCFAAESGNGIVRHSVI